MHFHTPFHPFQRHPVTAPAVDLLNLLLILLGVALSHCSGPGSGNQGCHRLVARPLHRAPAGMHAHPGFAGGNHARAQARTGPTRPSRPPSSRFPGPMESAADPRGHHPWSWCWSTADRRFLRRPWDMIKARKGPDAPHQSLVPVPPRLAWGGPVPSPRRCWSPASSISGGSPRGPGSSTASSWPTGGTRPWEIIRLQPGCGCTTAVVGQKTLAPGERTNWRWPSIPAGFAGRCRRRWTW